MLGDRPWEGSAVVVDGRRRVVLTGIGVVTSLGIGIDQLWSNLVNGVSGIRPIQSFDASRLGVRIAGEITDFDPRDWLTYKEIRQLDRFTHFAMAAADLALEKQDLGYLDRNHAGTLVGSAIGGASRIVEGVCTDLRQPNRVSPLFVPGAIANIASAAIAQRHNFLGPSGAPVTACASSADAVGQGYRLVRDGYASACLVGGAEACLVSPIIAGFENMRALSTRNDAPTEASRPFDAGRNGFVIAEGAAMLMLETADAAVTRGAQVFAEIRGYGQTNDGFHWTAPIPDGAAAVRAIRAALCEADLAPAQVDYVNAHATSTPLSDVTETRAIKHAFGEHSRRVAVSSTKSMTGHLLGAAGALEAAVCALVIQRGQIPPTINYTIPDPDCDLDYVPNISRTRDVNVAITNSFAFGGHNVSLVLSKFID